MGFFSGYCKRRIPVDFANGEVPIKGFFPPLGRVFVDLFILRIARVKQLHFRGGNVGI